MLVHTIMTETPVTAHMTDTLRYVSRLMRDGDFGCIIVIDSDRRPMGILTDRDIVVRAVAEGIPDNGLVAEVVTRDCVCININASGEDCRALMERRQVRRLLAVDDNECLRGIVSTADLAPRLPEPHAGRILKAICNGRSRLPRQLPEPMPGPTDTLTTLPHHG